MPKYWSYQLYQKVRVNEKARRDMPSRVSKTGVIIECLTGAIYDYKILFYEDDTTGSFKESELDLLN